jgi:hypothetical protein
MKERLATTLTILLILGFSSASSGEYLIYLKGGHYIVADNCTFPTRQEMRKDAETEEKAVLVEDCTKGKPNGRIFWSTSDGKFGEVNADDVYAILGGKNLAPIKPSSASPPLEDYLITSRGESFVNAKIIEQKEEAVYGVKRDELAKIDRRGVKEIAPEGVSKSRPGEGLCHGEPAEFAVPERDLDGNNFVGVVQNLSKASWKPKFEVEVRVNGKFKNKFTVEDSNLISPDDETSFVRKFDEDEEADLREYVKRFIGGDLTVRICYKKIKELSGPH